MDLRLPFHQYGDRSIPSVFSVTVRHYTLDSLLIKVTGTLRVNTCMVYFNWAIVHSFVTKNKIVQSNLELVYFIEVV